MSDFTFRIAELNDITRIQEIRNSVKENQLSDPGRVTDAICANFISRRGKGWVCIKEDSIIGFSIADLEDRNIRTNYKMEIDKSIWLIT